MTKIENHRIQKDYKSRNRCKISTRVSIEQINLLFCDKLKSLGIIDEDGNFTIGEDIVATGFFDEMICGFGVLKINVDDVSVQKPVTGALMIECNVPQSEEGFSTQLVIRL